MSTATALHLSHLSAATLGAVLEQWRQQSPACHLLALLPEAEAGQLPMLQAACRERGMALGGGIFPELLVEGREERQGAVLLRLDGAPPPLLLDEVQQAGHEVALAEQVLAFVERSLPEEQDAALFCIFDALVPNIATLLDACYLRLADRVHYVGVNAGSETFTSIPCVFDSERCVANGLLLQLLPDHPGGYLQHGYAAPDDVITATSASGNCIVQIDWRPALDVYRELLHRRYGVALDRDNFYTHAVHFPFAILRADGEVLVRIPVGLDEQGGIFCVGEIPPNSVLALLDAGSGIGHAAAPLTAEICQGPAADSLLTFYCAGRRMHTGPAAMVAELQEVRAGLPGMSHLGALTLGEIGGSLAGGYPLFHNATLVGVPWNIR